MIAFKRRRSGPLRRIKISHGVEPRGQLPLTMKITHTVEPLDSPESWLGLARLLGGEALDVVHNTIRHLRVLNTNSYVLEDPYIDQDYSTDYSQFYARTFRAYERYCKRVHFFSRDITPLLQRPLSTAQLRSTKRLCRTELSRVLCYPPPVKCAKSAGRFSRPV